MLRRGLIFVTGLLSGLLAAGLLLLLIAEPRGEPIELQPPPTRLPMRVHVTGAVRSPGVYDLAVGSIVADALDAAGGTTVAAAPSALNLAAPLQDGDKVFVPDRQNATEGAGIEATEEPGQGRIQINDATAPELEKLPGIGPSLATAIIKFREDHGPFSRPEDLLDVPGIGPAKLAAMEDLIQVP